MRTIADVRRRMQSRPRDLRRGTRLCYRCSVSIQALKSRALTPNSTEAYCTSRITPMPPTFPSLTERVPRPMGRGIQQLRAVWIRQIETTRIETEAGRVRRAYYDPRSGQYKTSDTAHTRRALYPPALKGQVLRAY